MTDIEARTPDAVEPAPAPQKPKVYGEWDGYSTPLPVTAHSVASAQEPVKTLPSKSNPAEWMFDRLVRMIDDFEKNLSDQEEIGGRMVGAPGEGSFHIDDIGFWGPDLIMFYGKNRDGRPVRLIQHYTQLSVLLTSMPKEKEKEAPRRIGFVIRERQETDAAAPAAPATPALEGPEQAEVEAHPS
jgi:hypothetical protein